jgi:hypothetical protein
MLINVSPFEQSCDYAHEASDVEQRSWVYRGDEVMKEVDGCSTEVEREDRE